MVKRGTSQIKVVILAGGFGTRLAEKSDVIPKPMVEIGGRPILWHIMKHYAYYGFKEFYIATGYKGDIIKRYFIDYYTLNGNITVNLSNGSLEIHNKECEDWIVHLMDTGLNTNTGGRIKRLEPWLSDNTFLMTYGDGVSDVNLRDLLKFHRSHKSLVTVTAVRPPARFGGLVFKGDKVIKFTEKPLIGEDWINGGFMVFEPGIFNYLDTDDTSLEKDALEKLASEGRLMAYRHDRFWQCMDTLRDVRVLESHWESGKAPWKVWE
jgi:glucose-1-phosphate cytidylyltransferase